MTVDGDAGPILIWGAGAVGGTIGACLARAEMVAHNRRSAKSHSGIWRDLAVRKRRTEVDEQIAIVAGIAAAHGRTTPVLDRLVRLVHEIEEGQRPQGRANLDALAEAAP